MIENGNRLATWGLQLNTDIENWKNTKESMSFCTPSPVPVRLCCTQVMYMLHANCCQCTLENERDLSSFTIWRGSIIYSVDKHAWIFFVSLNFSGCDSRAQSLHPFLSQTPSNQRRDGRLDQNWQGDLFGANVFPGPLFQEPADGGAVCCTLKFQQKCQI